MKAQQAKQCTTSTTPQKATMKQTRS